MYVKHYSRCSSFREIVVVWNKGAPPKSSNFDSAVPVRIRVEQQNSVNNRFKPDPLIETWAVLELDNDIMKSCDDIERGFRVWRVHPDRIVGFCPWLVTGAAFLDSTFAFGRYWDEEAKAGRELVDMYFTCEDVLMNYLYANSSGSSSNVVEYVRPARVMTTSKLSGLTISGKPQAHYTMRSECLRKFAGMYGGLSDRKVDFGRRKDGWDV